MSVDYCALSFDWRVHEVATLLQSMQLQVPQEVSCKATANAFTPGTLLPAANGVCPRGSHVQGPSPAPLELSDSRHVRLRTSSAAAAAATRRQRRVPPVGMRELMFVSDGDRYQCLFSECMQTLSMHTLPFPTQRENIHINAESNLDYLIFLMCQLLTKHSYGLNGSSKARISCSSRIQLHRGFIACQHPTKSGTLRDWWHTAGARMR